MSSLMETTSSKPNRWRFPTRHLLADGDLPFPDMQFSQLQFLIDISPAVRDRFSPAGDHTDPDIGTRFRVSVAQGWASTQAMVVPVDAPDSFDNPSLAVAIAREFLYDAFPQEPDTNEIYFQCLGPSPAHVDVSLKGVSTGEAAAATPFRRRDYSRPAYAQYVFDYNEAMFPSRFHAADDFFAYINSELDILYRIVLGQRRRSLDWGAVQADVGRIKAIQAQTGPSGTVARLRSRRDVGNAFIYLADIELAQAEARQSLAGSIQHTYGPGGMGLLQELVEAEFEEFHDLPTTQVSNLLRLFENRGLGDRELVAIALSSVVGGLVGAAATLLAGG